MVRKKPVSRRFVTLALAADELPSLVVGAGAVGTRKARTLAAAGAAVRVVAPQASPAIRRLAAAGRIRWLARSFRNSDLAGVRLVVAATDDAAVNRLVAKAARRKGLLVCMASSALDTGVLFPALLTRRGAVIAVHTHGGNTGRSKMLRDRLAALLR